MGKKYLKIIIGSIGIISIPSLALCSCSAKKDESEPTDPEEQKLGSIKILSDFSNLRLKTNDIFESSKVKVKCYDTNQKEMQSKYNLTLTQLSADSLNISIIDNKIHIDKNNKVGKYNYQLTAVSLDGSITSNKKDLNIEIYDDSTSPNKLEILGDDNLESFFPCDKSFEYQIVAKKDEQIIQDYCDVNTSLSIKSSSTSLTKDLFNNPLFNYIKDKNKIFLSISKNIDSSYQGTYVIELKIELPNNPSIFSIKTITFKLVDSTSYYDSANKYYYSRKDTSSTWELKNISSDQQSLNADKFTSEIYQSKVTKIGNNFCSTSGINSMASIELPSYIETIGEHAFDTQEGLSQAYIDQVKYIEDYAFNNCSLLKIDPTKHFNFISIGNYAFKGCQSFKGKYFDDIESIGEHAFESCIMKEIHFGNKLLILGADCLSNCSLLKDIYISSSKPPQLMGEIIGGSTPLDCKIHVPITAIDAYRNHPNWTIYQNILVGDITV